MDLNELLYAHQVEVMKASACVDDDHIARIAEYAAQIRQLRTLSTATPIAQDPSAPPTLIYSSYAGNSTEEGCAAPLTLSHASNDGAREESENPDRGRADA